MTSSGYWIEQIQLLLVYLYTYIYEENHIQCLSSFMEIQNIHQTSFKKRIGRKNNDEGTVLKYTVN